MLILLNELVSQLDGKAEVEVEDARLTYILHLGTRLTDLCLLIPCGLVLILRARLPPEDGEGSLARLTLSGELRARHTHIRIVAKACLTQDGEVALLPTLLVNSSSNAETSLSHFN